VPPSSAHDPSRPEPTTTSALPPPKARAAGVLRQRAQPGLLGALAAGGAVGTGARDWISTEVHITAGTFPWSTFWVNIAGSFVLGVGLIVILERLPPGRYLRPFFATGVCGGFTTFSTLMVEADLLVHRSRPLTAAAYLISTLIFGLAAVAIGVVWGRALPLELAPLFGHRVQPRRRRPPP
jgi:CrcB protein